MKEEPNVMNREKVVLATVTCNSSGYLERLIEAAQNQAYPLWKIVVTDNASSPEHAAKIKALADRFDNIHYIRLQNNTGGAGGFEAGFRYILENMPEADWIWVMDDDAFPREDTLEKLLAHRDIPGMGALAPLIFGNELQKYQIYHHKRASRYLDTDISVAGSERELTEECTPIEANAFVGPLIKMSVVKDIGVPDGSLFIYGDDTEYTYRISRKYGLYLVRDAVINHRDVFTGSGVRRPNEYWKDYYKYRNRFLFIRKYRRSFKDGLIGSLKVIREIAGGLKAACLNPGFKGRRKLRISVFLLALRDGLLGRSGKRLDPADFLKYKE